MTKQTQNAENTEKPVDDNPDASRSAVAPTDDSVVTESPRERMLGVLQRQGGLGALIVVVVAASIFSSGFATSGNLETLATNNAYEALLALGMTFVIISGGIDLSVGSVLALGVVLGAWGVNHGGILMGIFAPLVVCALIGLIQGLLIAKARLAPFIVTLAGMLFARGLQQAVADNNKKTYNIGSNSPFLDLAQGTWRPIITAVVLFLIGGLVLSRTRFGQALFAIGGNENAAVLMGLPVLRTKVGVYVLSATIAGGAGMLTASQLQSGVVDNVGTGYELVAIAAVIIGGTLLTGGSGSVIGTASGVLLLLVIQNLIGHHFSQSTAASQAVNGGFLAVVALLQTLLTRRRRLA